MSIISIQNIILKNNPSKFNDEFHFDITFETLEHVKEGIFPLFSIFIYIIEIEWKFIYIGCANDQKYDQVLDAFTMGPLKKGVMQFALKVSISPPFFHHSRFKHQMQPRFLKTNYLELPP